MKKKKRKLKIKGLIILLSVLIIVFFSFFFIFSYNIKNIIIEGNNLTSDKEIKETLNIDLNKNFFTNFSILMEMKLNKNKIIKSSNIKKEFIGIIRIKVKEYKPFFIINDSLIVFENKMQIQDDSLLKKVEIPYLISKLSNETFESLILAMNDIDYKIINKISEIEYSPTELDKERFLFLMRDGNYAYISLNNIENINYYNKIVPKLEGKKGIINFDSYRKNDAGISITLIE